MNDPTEVYAGTPMVLTMVFKDESGTLTDVTAGTLVIQPGYDTADAVTVDFGSWQHTATGTYLYSYDTTSKATASTGPVDVVAQVQSTGGIDATADPVVFRILPPAVTGLT